jgi:hypothetical protein
VRISRSAGLSAALGLLICGGMAWAPAASAKTSHCLVINNAINTSYTSLQDAVNHAAAGATLWVRGTCAGGITVGTNLTITGQQPRGFTAPTLNGGGPVIQIGSETSAPTVTINTLTITGGVMSNVSGGGAGILNFGSLTLNGVSITGNAITGGMDSNGGGAGIFNFSGSVTLNNSSVTDNTVSGGLSIGGGIYTQGGGLLTLNNSSVTDNTVSGSFSSPSGGGIFGGPVVLNNSTVSGNTAAGPQGEGGGIVNVQDETLTMTGTSTITGNTAGYEGGGIYNYGTLVGAVAGTGPGGNVYDNQPDNIFNA